MIWLSVLFLVKDRSSEICKLILLARSSGVSHDAMNAEKAGVTGGVLMESGDKKTTRDFYKTSLKMKYLPYQLVQDLFQQYGYHICNGFSWQIFVIQIGHAS